MKRMIDVGRHWCRMTYYRGQRRVDAWLDRLPLLQPYNQAIRIQIRERGVERGWQGRPIEKREARS